MYPEIKYKAVDYARYQWFNNKVKRGFGARFLDRGFEAFVGRSSIGTAPRDPTYLDHKLEAEEFRYPFLAYGVNWPVNKTPELEAMTFSSQAVDPQSPAKPLVYVADIELGVSNDNYGHSDIPGAELYQINKRYVLKLAEHVAPTPVWIYTGKWYWNNPKLLPHIDGYELQFPVWPASYPWGNNRVDFLNPWDVLPDVKPAIPEPWASASNWEELIAAWQWTSSGYGIKYGICESDKIDQDLIFHDLGSVEPPPNSNDDIVQLNARMMVVESDVLVLEQTHERMREALDDH